MNIFERIKKARRDAGLSQSDLARKANLSRTSIHNYEQGRYIPSIADTIIIAKVCGVSLDWLAYGDSTERDASDYGTADRVMEPTPPYESQKHPVELDHNEIELINGVARFPKLMDVFLNAIRLQRAAEDAIKNIANGALDKKV